MDIPIIIAQDICAIIVFHSAVAVKRLDYSGNAN
jgi:hypothetical protein